MKFSENWLRTLVDPPLTSGELAHALTMAGLEVEAIETAAPAFDRVVVGELGFSPDPIPTAEESKKTKHKSKVRSAKSQPAKLPTRDFLRIAIFSRPCFQLTTHMCN